MGKKYFISLILALVCIQYSRAQSYQIDKANNKIVVSGDCEINVSDFAPDGIDVYGDKGGDGTGSIRDLFKYKTEQLNNVRDGITFQKKSGKALIKLEFSKLKPNTTLKFYAAKSKDVEKKDSTGKVKKRYKDWSPNTEKIFSIIITKSVDKGPSDINESVSNEGTMTTEMQASLNTYDINSIKSELNNLTEEMDKLRGKQENTIDSSNYPLWLAIIALLVISVLLFIKNKKDLGLLAKEISGLEKKMTNLNSKMNEQAQDRLKLSHKEKTIDTMSRIEIQKFVVEQIRSIRTPQVQQPTEIHNQEKPQRESIQIPQQNLSINTDQVKYHDADMPYFSLEQTQTPIFKIFTQGEDYYYTIVDDPTIREEIVGMIQGYEGCLTYQTSAGMAKRIEPVSPGKLRRDGDKFYVDANNKLIVKYV